MPGAHSPGFTYLDHSMDYVSQRRHRLARSLKPAGLDALLVTNPLNVTYLTGFTGDSSFVLLTPKRTILISDERYTGQIRDECPELETSIRGHSRNTYQEAAEVISKLSIRAVGIESSYVTLSAAELLKELVPSVNWSPRRSLVEDLRAIKDPSEVGQIRAAIDIGAKAFGVLRALLSPTDTEKELADSLEATIRKLGGRGNSFDPIIAVGDRSALPHCPPTDRTVAAADFMLVDWGVQGRLYQSDLTRVIRTVSTVSRQQSLRSRRVETRLEKVYTIVLQAQARAIAAVRPGATAKEVDTAARSFIEEAGYGERFNHGLGHGIGLQTHEAPAVRQNSTDVLQAGMVITIEPGIYIPGWGGVRIEDDLLVTSDGCEVLSAAVPKSWNDTAC